ncbi:MAG: hypothetical protein ACE14M_02115 [Terriglobales bacterium]
MKRVQLTLCTILAALAASVFSLAQQPAAKPDEAKPGAPGQPQVPELQQRAPRPTPLPQAKTQEEYKAYNDAIGIGDPLAMEAAANDFAAKYKDSELRPLLFLRAMTLYQNANNADKTLDMARKVLAINGDHPVALVTAATVLAEGTRETDLDRDQRLNEAIGYAQKALTTIETHLAIPPGTPPERVDAAKKVLTSMAYAAMGTAELSRNNYPVAETNLRKATEINTVQPDAITWLRLAVVLDHEQKYQEAMTAATKAFELSPSGSPQRNLAAQERERLSKLAGAEAPASAQGTQASDPAPPPTSPAKR